MIMGFSNTFSLHSHTIISTNHNLCTYSSTKPSMNYAPIKKTPTSPIPKANLLASSKPEKKMTHLPKEKSLQRILVEKAVGFVVGSVIFVGCFNTARKPAIAIIPNLAKSSEKREELEDEEEEEALYDKLLESEPENVDALKVALYGKMRRGKTSEAVKFVERLAELEPEEVEWRLLMALCCELMGQLSKAKRLFKEILMEKPLLLRALHGLAMVMHKNHEGSAVFVMLNKALDVARREKRVTEERNIKILIAQMHVVRGELEEGLKEFQTLIEEDYRDFRPYLCLGIIYSLQDKKKEAAEHFEMYRSLVPEEFPERGFLDDVVMTAKTKSREQLQQEFQNEYSRSK